MNAVVLLVFVVCIAVGAIGGYFFGVKKGTIVVNLKTQEMNEMADRMADLESYFQDTDALLSEVEERGKMRG